MPTTVSFMAFRRMTKKSEEDVPLVKLVCKVSKLENSAIGVRDAYPPKDNIKS